MLLKGDSVDVYSRFITERDIFMSQVTYYQEDTLIGLVAYKDMRRWYKKTYQALERIEYIREVQTGQDTEEHGIQLLTYYIITKIQRAVEHWMQMVQEPHQKMQEIWEECVKSWVKINKEMRDIHLTKFGQPEDLTYLHDVVRQPTKKDQAYEVEISQILTLVMGHIKKFMKPLIGASEFLQTVKCQVG
jgi:hypothetical protein